jgi:hypothetical protein
MQQWRTQFVERKEAGRLCDDPEKSTISNDYEGESFSADMERCLKALSGQEGLGAVPNKEFRDFALSINKLVEPIPGLRFYEDRWPETADAYRMLYAEADGWTQVSRTLSSNGVNSAAFGDTISI